MLDLVIIGGGPAGLSAAANGAAEGLTVHLIEAAGRFGGQAGTSSRIENYLGFPEGLSGPDLTRRAVAQAERLGATLELRRRAVSLTHDGDAWRVECAGGDAYRARAVLVASGAEWRQLDAPGATGATRLHYGAAPEFLARFAGESVAIIGAANSAGQAALYLAGNGAHVTILARRTLDAAMSAYLVSRIRRHPRIEAAEHCEVSAVAETADVAALALKGAGAAQLRGALTVSAAFVYIGARPAAAFVAEHARTDERGFVLPAAPGTFAASGAAGLYIAGDIRSGSRKRVATAAGEGATATAEVWSYCNAAQPQKERTHVHTVNP